MGASSKTVQNNPLLVRDSVGKGRPSVYTLPAPEHVYGKRVERNPEETAAKVLTHWNVKASSKHAVPALDYITMNRNATKQGLDDPKAIRMYRKEHPVRMKVGDNAVYAKLTNGETSAELRRQRLVGPLPSDGNKEFAYGKPTRPSTPVACLMTDVYQRQWVEEQEKRAKEREVIEKERAKRKQTKTVTPAKVPLPKKILLVDKDPKTLFKLSKFTHAQPKIDARRPKEGEGKRPETSKPDGKKGVPAPVAAAAAEAVKAEAVKAEAERREAAVQQHEKKEVRFTDEKPAAAPAKAAGDVAKEVPKAKKYTAEPGRAPEGWEPSPELLKEVKVAS
ncbi:hypothetical protein HDU96_005211 [Phlyctochytrium bullatum]|nr:hypothetical protein HDU96_005211 [Phlyctochytrium bullatum]